MNITYSDFISDTTNTFWEWYINDISKLTLLLNGWTFSLVPRTEVEPGGGTSAWGNSTSLLLPDLTEDGEEEEKECWGV